MIRQKSKFWTFLFSLAPGCGHLYMGFMKRGVSLIILFAAPIVVASVLGLDVIGIISAVVWCYAFFDALNLNNAPPDIFAIQEDEFLLTKNWDPNGMLTRGKLVRYIGIGLIVLGVVALWNMIIPEVVRSWYVPDDSASMTVYATLSWLSYMIPRVLISAAAIIFGIVLVTGKKKKLPEETHEQAD